MTMTDPIADMLTASATNVAMHDEIRMPYQAEGSRSSPEGGYIEGFTVADDATARARCSPSR